MTDLRVLKLANPILKTWSSESHLMSMILQQKNAKDWILNNYINILGKIYMQGRKRGIAFFPSHDPEWHEAPITAWTGCPFLDAHYVSHHHVKENYVDILEYIMNAIEQDYYVYVKLRQDMLTKGMQTVVHKVFVYGFDRKERKLYVADHYNNLKYAREKLDFEEFLRAYNATYWGEEEAYNLAVTDKKVPYEKERLIVARPREFEYEFNLDWFRIQLRDYLDSGYSVNCVVPLWFEEDDIRYFGMSCYDLLLEYVQILSEKPETVDHDWRLFTFMADHKTILRMRIDYFRENGIGSITTEEIEGYNKLCQSATMAINLFLKYTFTHRHRCLESLRTILLQMKQLERELLEPLLEKIS